MKKSVPVSIKDFWALTVWLSSDDSLERLFARPELAVFVDVREFWCPECVQTIFV